MTLYTGGAGIPLKDIIKMLGNNQYKIIAVRCKWELNGEMNDDLIGYCSYDGYNLIPLDGDSYSLNDLYVEWEESVDTYDNGAVILTVWEKGVIKE